MREIEILQSLKKNLDEKFGIKKIAVFGSVARNEATQESDIDIAILDIKEKNYFKRVEAKYFLEEKLNRRVDIGYFDTMRKIIQDEIKKDFIYV
jgi:predicted nucleotidyltransferase